MRLVVEHFLLCFYLAIVISVCWSALNKETISSMGKEFLNLMGRFIIGIVIVSFITFFITSH